MNKIILSCPYNGIQDLYESLYRIKGGGDLIFDTKDIKAIDDDSVYIGREAEKHKIKSFTGAFIRYPYDLIEPHTGTYQRREHTEFLKTVAVLFESVAVNPIQKAHFVRNRLYSLLCARECGLKTPESIIYKTVNIKTDFGSQKITKSLGNCYFSSQFLEKEDGLKEFLSFEKDNEDTAYIYKPHVIKSSADINKHIRGFGTLLLQNKIEGEEYRVFIVGEEIFYYKRERIKSLDKSSAGLVRAEKGLFEGCEESLLKLAFNLNLKYLCMDIIIDKEPFVIDVNPFGSFPKNYPEVVDSLAKLILAKRD